MKALTICQPYAELFMLGDKRVENREWATNYRGPLLIHAGKSKEWLMPGDLQRFPDMPFGAIVGRVNLVECIHVSNANRLAASDPQRFGWVPNHDHTNGPFLWITEDTHRLLNPMPCRGAQGLWDYANWIDEAEMIPVLLR